jgi:hypothetical protein
MPRKSESRRLRTQQTRRAEREDELADKSPDEEERQTHERRADKAEYLADKLAEQEQAPDE